MSGPSALLPANPVGPALPWREALPYVVLFALATLPFAGALRASFVFDDRLAIQRNPVVRGAFSPRAILGSGFWGEGESDTLGSYRPLTVLTFVADHRLGGGGPAAFHATNLFLHGLTVLVCFWALRRRTGDGRLALVAAGLLAVHALHTENVAGIVGRADVLATGLGVLAYALARERRLAAAAAAGPVLLLALLAKETGIAFLALAAADDLLGLDRARDQARRARVLAYAAMGLALAVYLGMRWYALGRLGAPVHEVSNPLVGTGIVERVLTAGALLSRTLGLLGLPLVLSADYSFAEILPARTLLRADVLLGLAVLALLPVGAVLLRQRRPLLALGLAAFLVAYLPVANLLYLVPTIFAERLLYAASLGACLAIAAAVVPLLRPDQDAPPRHRRVAVALLALLGLLHAGRAALRTEDWRSQRALFTAAVAASPGSARAHVNLGVEELGDRRYPEAAARFQRAVVIAPRYVRAWTYLGIALAQAGQPEAAHRALREAFSRAPTDPEPAENLVLLYLRHGRVADAEATVSELLQRGGSPRLAARLRSKIAALRRALGAPRSDGR